MPGSTLLAPSTAEPTTGPHRPGLVLTALLTCQLMIILDVTVMNVALPRIRDDLGFSATGLSWVMSSYTLVFGGLLLLGGRAGDLLGRRRLLIAGVTVFTVASLAGGFADSPATLVAARIAQGLGAAMAGPSTLALLATSFTDPRARMRALALFSGMASAGFAVGLIAGGLLTEWLSWRSVLFINVPVGALIVVLALLYVPEPARHPARLDLLGAATGSAGIAALVYGFIRAASDGWGDGLTAGSLVAGVVLLATFLLVEARTAEPLLPLRLFADRNRAAAFVNFLLGPMAGMSMFFFLTQYLQDVHGYGALATGVAFLPMALVLFTTTRFIAVLLPRFGPKPLALTGAVLMSTGIALLSRLDVDSAYAAGLLPSMLLMGLGMGLAIAPLNVVVMTSVPPADAGAAGGVLQTMQQAGATLGLAILVTVFGASSRDAAAAGAAPDQVLVAGMTDAFVAGALIAATAVLVALTFRSQRRADPV
ncbi:MFS transporter [Jiangella alkaliphila]|uniref:Drug resistance transporter, EmrB/QacA subfamily n=1 Tax=Jiangella alkaliphila TaxID=419479 RepID=A0A1H2LJ98_9ACTN|nr:MFS transporter [Jiangella alkaliphila]SDU80932.1 drug resistance transporter, EmrB/QacA subfamily [Jiangella alkaliphila]